MPIPITLVLAGDLLTGRGVAAVLSQPQNTIWCYQPILAGADLTLGNLEAAPKSKFTGRKPFYNVGDLKILRDVGFDGFSLANNHTLDAGEIGARQTQISLTQLGLNGAGLTLGQSDPIPIWKLNGRRVAVVAATNWGPFSSGHALPIYVAFERDGRRQLACGATYSYYEFTQPTSERLSDAAWQALLATPAAPKMPAWTKSFVSRVTN